MDLVLIGFKVPSEMKAALEDLAWRRRSTLSKVLKKLVEDELKKDAEEL